MVRGQVHSESTGAHLRDLFNRFGSNFETIIIEDPTQVWPSSVYLFVRNLMLFSRGVSSTVF